MTGDRAKAHLSAAKALWPAAGVEHQRAVFGDAAGTPALAAPVGQQQRHHSSLMGVAFLPFGTERRESFCGKNCKRALELDEKAREQAVAVDQAVDHALDV